MDDLYFHSLRENQNESDNQGRIQRGKKICYLHNNGRAKDFPMKIQIG